MASELDEVSSCIISLVTQHGAEMDIRQLSRDYMELMGSDIPVKKLNYPSLTALVKNISGLTTRERQGVLYLSLSTNVDVGLTTINVLVGTQMKPSKKVHRKSARGRGGAGYRGSARGRHPRFPSGSVYHPQLPGSCLRSPQYPKFGMPYIFGKQGGSVTSKHNNMPPAAKQVTYPSFGFNKTCNQNAANHPSFGFSKTSNQTTATRPIPLLSNSQPVFGSTSPLLPTPPPPLIANPIKAKPMVSLKQLPLLPNPIPNNQQQFSLPLNGSTTPVHLAETPKHGKSCNEVGVINVQEQKSQQLSCKQQLEEEISKNLPGHTAIFTFMIWGKKSKFILCTVQIGKLKVSSYPEEYTSRQAAEEYVSKKALQEVQKMAQELTKQTLPVTCSAAIYTPRIRLVVENASGGKVPLWQSRVEELYCETHKESLPQGWVEEVMARAEEVGLLVETPCDQRYMFSLPMQTPSAPLQDVERPSSQSSSTADDCGSKDINGYASDHSSLTTSEGAEGGGEEIEEQGLVSEVDSRLPPLILPPGPYWDVFIMYIEDTNAIFLRILGEKYSEAYDDLLTDLELHYMEEKNLNPVEVPTVGGLYAASHEESWFRVKVLEVNDKQVKVLFVDHGDAEVIEVTNLHHLQDCFLTVPAQCVRCCLSGLEYARSDPSAMVLLQNLALGQTLVAEVIESGRRTSGAGQGRQKAQPLVLFNTAGEDDININKKVSEHLANNFPEPKLPQVGGVAEVYLVQASGNGDLFVQVESNTFCILENLLHLARNRTEEILGEGMEIDLTRLYLAKFSQDGEWYRAAPRSTPDPNGKVLMNFVDFGNCERVPLANMRPLPTHGDQLTKIPHQALRCKLHKVPGTLGLQWTSRASQRLVDLSPVDSPLLLKVHEAGVDGGPPLVELFKRLPPQNELVSLNATLSLDASLFSDGDSNNNSVEKDLVLSPTRSRSRQSSSTSQSSNSQGLSSGPSSLSSPPGSLPSSPRPDDSLSPLTPPKQEVPHVGEYYDVLVTYAASPSNFAVQSWKMSKKLSHLQSKIQNHYDAPNKSTAPTSITVGGYYAVKHNDSTWYRAYVNMLQQDIVAGLFIDYGDCFVTSSDLVRPLEPQFCKLPCQAIKAKLHGIKPVNKDWTMEDSRRFQRLVEYREFVSAVMDCVPGENGSAKLSLALIDTRDPKRDMYIDQILVEEGRALRKM
ncbi:hypothetical protein Pmani_029459 [Petrolisthes manimaculis]|uniref:Tudor domain-containing protein 7 n=1 Tax=Petrolisthes manimaculis TaxID=1843537 RepID=A0AAE1TUL0_9EUCA|nr:hypothetical protein Pmani_029459 [Petrolisthes manimaculis]